MVLLRDHLAVAKVDPSYDRDFTVPRRLKWGWQNVVCVTMAHFSYDI